MQAENPGNMALGGTESFTLPSGARRYRGTTNYSVPSGAAQI